MEHAKPDEHEDGWSDKYDDRLVLVEASHRGPDVVHHKCQNQGTAQQAIADRAMAAGDQKHHGSHDH